MELKQMADIKLLATRVYNKSKSCMLMRQYKSGMWAFPTTSIPVDDDPVFHIHDFARVHILGDYDIIAAVGIFEFTMEDASGDKSFNYVYDIIYNGFILPHIPDLTRYKNGRWMMIEAIKKEKDLTHLMQKFMSLMEKSKCIPL